MKQIRIRSMKDMMALPEGKLFEVTPGPDFHVAQDVPAAEVPEGLDIDDSYEEYVTVYRDEIVLPVPPRVARRFGGRGGLRFEARFEGPNLIVKSNPQPGPSEPQGGNAVREHLLSLGPASRRPFILPASPSQASGASDG